MTRNERTLSGGRRVRQLEVPSTEGRLESILFYRNEENPSTAAVFCHPHPQYGGTMHNKVAYRASEAIFQLGVPVLRFNFRGVGKSEGTWTGGTGEEEDAVHAVQYLRDLYPDRTLLLGGFSFGAAVALAVGHAMDEVGAMLAVAPSPTRRDLTFLSDSHKPKGIIQGTRDELCPLPDLQEAYPRWGEPKELRLIEGAGHFFDEQIPELQESVREIVRSPAFADAIGLGSESAG